MATVIDGDLEVSRHFNARTITLPASTVTDASVLAAANIAASKLEHQYQPLYAQASATTAAAATVAIWRVFGETGSVVAVEAGLVSPNVGAAACTVDIKKNGTTILTGTIPLTSAEIARQSVAGTLNLSAAALVDGDMLEVVTTATAGGGTLGTGLFVSLKIREKA